MARYDRQASSLLSRARDVFRLTRIVIASEAKQSRQPRQLLDCFVALLLAMTAAYSIVDHRALGLRAANAAFVDLSQRPADSIMSAGDRHAPRRSIVSDHSDPAALDPA